MIQNQDAREIHYGFETGLIELAVDDIVPTKMLGEALQFSAKYKKILSSIKEVGVIEPPAVTKQGESYILLDGHLRLQALKQLKQPKVQCLLSQDDEAFTYNKHINRLSPIQEHRMIQQAIAKGVPQEKIARALNVDVRNIMQKQKLLNGICEEAVLMLKDKMVANGVFPLLKRMKPLRQVEAVTLMNDTGTYSISYAKALLAATPQEQLVQSKHAKKVKGLNSEQMERMEQEMESLQREYKQVEQHYGRDVLNLTLAKGYLGSLLENAHIVRYLAQHQPEILTEFQKITEMTLLDNMLE